MCIATVLVSRENIGFTLIFAVLQCKACSQGGGGENRAKLTISGCNSVGLYFARLWLVGILFDVGLVKISCWVLQTTFSFRVYYEILLRLKKHVISTSLVEEMTYIPES